jgi:hypothetical protein
MSPPTSSEIPAGSDGELYAVRVEDTISPALAGHQGCTYVSPPQSRDQALALVALLAGSRQDLEPCRTTWTQPIAGGQRRISLVAVAAP